MGARPAVSGIPVGAGGGDCPGGGSGLFVCVGEVVRQARTGFVLCAANCGDTGVRWCGVEYFMVGFGKERVDF